MSSNKVTGLNSEIYPGKKEYIKRYFGNPKMSLDYNRDPTVLSAMNDIRQNVADNNILLINPNAKFNQIRQPVIQVTHQPAITQVTYQVPTTEQSGPPKVQIPQTKILNLPPPPKTPPVFTKVNTQITGVVYPQVPPAVGTTVYKLPIPSF